MNVNITSKNMRPTEALTQCISRHFIKLDKFKLQFTNSHIVLAKEANCFLAKASCHLSLKKNLDAHAKDQDMYAALKLLFQRLERQLKNLRSKKYRPKYSHCAIKKLIVAE